jgi:DNA-binding beta-propeller fold protein YncE
MAVVTDPWSGNLKWTSDTARRSATFALAAMLPWACWAGGVGALPAYHVAARYEIGGTEAGYDYLRVDSASRRLFVAHGTRVDVINADSGIHLGEVPRLAGVHGIEIVGPLNIAFATSGADRTVAMFNPGTLEIVKKIKYLGAKPDALQYDPSSRLLFVVNGGETGDISVIRPATGAIVDTVDLAGGKLEEISFDGRGHGFVNDEQKSVVHVFDTRTRKRLAAWPLAPAQAPTGLAIDRERHRLFAACGNRLLAILDSDSGKMLGTAPIGADPDGVAFERRSGRIFTSNRDGTLSVIGEVSPGSYALQQTVPTAPGARTIALDDKTGRLFLPAGRFGAAPAPTAAEPEPHAPLIPESFAIIVVAP